MFSALAGMVMAAKVHFNQMKYPFIKKQDQQVAEYLYKNNVDKKDETEKYEKSRLPESGYMTQEEYEARSKAKTRREINAKIVDKAEMPKDENMVYVPQYKFKLVKYNDPVGSPELSLPRKLNFDRQINAQGIVASDFSKMVYPSVYYYAQSDCTSCDLYVINLDPSLSNLEKVEKANVVNREPIPILSTDKSVDKKFIFRTLTPIDFSSDNTKLVVKEKVGHRHDGIWKTSLWIYDFNQKQAKQLPEIREAIVHYWIKKENINLDEKRWDIYPMGFDANDENRIIVCAYAYTGTYPIFLGTWSIDIDGERSKLESLTETSIPVSIVGLRLEKESDVVPLSEVEFNLKQTKDNAKAKEKREKTNKKFEDAVKKTEYQRKIHQMDMDTMLKIKQRQDYLKQKKESASSVLSK